MNTEIKDMKLSDFNEKLLSLEKESEFDNIKTILTEQYCEIAEQIIKLDNNRFLCSDKLTQLVNKYKSKFSNNDNNVLQCQKQNEDEKKTLEKEQKKNDKPKKLNATTDNIIINNDEIIKDNITTDLEIKPTQPNNDNIIINDENDKNQTKPEIKKNKK